MKDFKPDTAQEWRRGMDEARQEALSGAQVVAPAEHREGTAAELVEGDVFSVDAGRTWYVAALPQWGQVVSVYADRRRDEDAPTVRVDADADTACLIRVVSPVIGSCKDDQLGDIRSAAVDGDVVGRIWLTFRNAINGNRMRLARPDIVSARRLAAHFRPYNNTEISARIVTRTDGTTTIARRLDLRVGGRYVFCRCFRDDESQCTRVEELTAEIAVEGAPK